METEIEALRILVKERDQEIARLNAKIEQMQIVAIQISKLINDPAIESDLTLVLPKEHE